MFISTLLTSIALDGFPAVFRTRIQRLLYRPVIELSFVGDIASDEFIDTLACVLTVEMFMPETDAVSQSDAAFEMFFMVSGAAEVLLEDETVIVPKQRAVRRSSSRTSLLRHSQDDGMDDSSHDLRQIKYISVSTVGKGECFGETSFMFNLLQPFTVRTSTICRMLSLKREAWDMVQASYPGQFLNIVLFYGNYGVSID